MSLALTTGLVPAINPDFLPERFVVDSLGTDGAGTFNPSGQRLTTGTVTILPVIPPVPEPSTLALGGIGGMLALGVAWRRRRAA
jgi:PEP-CTERM motif